MVSTLPDSNTRRTIADALDQQADDILREWLAWLRENSLTRAIHALPQQALENHIPPVLRILADFLRNPVAAVRDETVGHLRMHAQIRKEQGYDLQELMIEFDYLTQIINRRMSEVLDQQGQISPRAVADTFCLLNIGQRSLASVTVGLYRDKEEEQQAQISRRLNEFAETLAHEVRQPLQAISMGAELLRKLAEAEDSTETDTEERDHYLDVIFKGLSRTQQLIDELQMLASSGKARLEEDWSTPVDIVDKVVQELQPMAENREVELIVDKDWPAVEMAALPVKLALLNVVNNAIKYSDPDKPQKWVKICAEWAPSEDHIGPCRIAVEDNGKGIPAEAHQHVFQRHFRAHPELTRGWVSAWRLPELPCMRPGEISGSRVNLTRARPS